MANDQCKARPGLTAKAWALLDELEKVRSAPVGESDWRALNNADDELRAVLDGIEAAPVAAAWPTRDKIREVFVAHGFTVKDGHADLKEYVYEAAYALLALVAESTTHAPPQTR